MRHAAPKTGSGLVFDVRNSGVLYLKRPPDPLMDNDEQQNRGARKFERLAACSKPPAPLPSDWTPPDSREFILVSTNGPIGIRFPELELQLAGTARFLSLASLAVSGPT